MSKRRVVVTGLGMLTPVGNDVTTSWEAIKKGQSGIRSISHFDASDFTTQFAGTLKDFDVNEYLAPKEARKMDPFIQYGMVVGIQAFTDCGIEVSDKNSSRIGVAIGSGIGGLNLIESNHDLIKAKGPKKVSPFFVPGSIINMISGNLAIKFGLKGPNIAIVTACTTGTHNIGYGARTIAYGDADVMIVGGAECASTPLGMAGFCAARALSTRNDDPQSASRPWDADRDGFVLGDGAGALVLEEYEHAKARGAKIYAELSGFGMSDDAHHMTAPPEDGSGAAASMESALKDAKLNADQIDYLNAHGTSTPLGDKAETQAIKSVMSDHSSNIAVSSTKSMIGHSLGATGAVEAIFSILAIQDQVAPPTINLDKPGEGCDLDYVPNIAREMKIQHALSNSFGFGGTNGTLIFSKI